MPVAPTAALLPLVERWQATLAQAGYDVRGDLAMLDSRTPSEPTLPGPRDQLGVAVDALADALAENARLRTRVSRARGASATGSTASAASGSTAPQAASERLRVSA